jgi:hypothetical protein
MRKQFLCAAALAAAAMGAQAQSTFRGVASAAITGGGETLATVDYSDGSSKNIKSGGLLDLKVGFEYREPSAPWAVQASVGYHFDNTSASNGSVRFSRFPIEVLGYWYPNQNFRLGGGLRVATGAKFHSSGVAAYLGNYSIDSKPGVVVEGEYMFNPSFGLGLRYVAEKYELNGVKFDGNHVGLRANFYF